MSEILFVTWDGGGNVPPALAVAGELRERGHSVRVLGHAAQAAEISGAGFDFVRPRHARRFSSRDRNTPLTMMATFADAGLGRDLLEAVAARPADLVVIDCLMFGALRAAHDAGLPYAVLEHLYDGYYRRGILGGPLGLYLRLRRIRAQAALDAARARILMTLPELDPTPGGRRNLHQVGPVVAVGGPHPAGRPTVLVSLSTFGFPRMRENLQAVLDATRGLDARVVVTTGPAVDPAELDVPPGVEVHRFVPHAELMPQAQLVVGHGGHGTTMQALAHDLPVLVLPMDRLSDQPHVGRSLEEAGAGRMLPKGSPPERIAPVLAELLADGPHRAAAARLGAGIRSRSATRLGADVVEELVGRTASHPTAHDAT